MKFNEAAKELMKYDKKAVIDQKLQTVREEIKELDQKYDQDMAKYEQRERYLKSALASLQMFLKDFDSKDPQREATPFVMEVENGEDDGQI